MVCECVWYVSVCVCVCVCVEEEHVCVCVCVEEERVGLELHCAGEFSLLWSLTQKPALSLCMANKCML